MTSSVPLHLSPSELLIHRTAMHLFIFGRITTSSFSSPIICLPISSPIGILAPAPHLQHRRLPHHLQHLHCTIIAGSASSAASSPAAQIYSVANCSISLQPYCRITAELTAALLQSSLLQNSLAVALLQNSLQNYCSTHCRTSARLHLQRCTTTHYSP